MPGAYRSYGEYKGEITLVPVLRDLMVRGAETQTKIYNNESTQVLYCRIQRSNSFRSETYGKLQGYFGQGVTG